MSIQKINKKFSSCACRHNVICFFRIFSSHSSQDTLREIIALVQNMIISTMSHLLLNTFVITLPIICVQVLLILPLMTALFPLQNK